MRRVAAVVLTVWASTARLEVSLKAPEGSPAEGKAVRIIQDNGATGTDPSVSQTSPIPGLLKAADQAAKNRDYSTCAQVLEKVVAIDPKYKNGWNYLGWTYNAMGQFTKAEAALRKAIEVDPKDPRAYNNLGQALAAQKKYPEAIEQYQRQVEINSKDQWAHANMGRVYIQMKEYEKALAQLEIAGSISPNDASIPFNMGRAYTKLRQPDHATKAFEKSVELQPVPLRWNAVAYEMADETLDLKAAEKYAQQAIAAQVLQMQQTSLHHVTREDAYAASRIASYGTHGDGSNTAKTIRAKRKNM